MRVRTDQVVAVSGEMPVRPPPAAGRSRSIEVPASVHVDDAVIVIDKPAGLVVHPGAGTRGRDTGQRTAGPVSRARRRGGGPTDPGIVHRLDKGHLGPDGRGPDRSGLPGSRGPALDAHGRAGVRGAGLGSAGHPAGHDRCADRAIPPRSASHDGERRRAGPPGPTTRSSRPFDRPGRSPRVVCRLETGRTHQIRVHLRTIGHPVVGDERTAGAPAAPDWTGRSCTRDDLAVHPPGDAASRWRSTAPLADDLDACSPAAGSARV